MLSSTDQKHQKIPHKTTKFDIQLNQQYLIQNLIHSDGQVKVLTKVDSKISSTSL